MENIEIQKKELENNYQFVPYDICDELVKFSAYNQYVKQHCNTETLSPNHLTFSISSSSKNVIREDISYNNIDTLSEDNNSDTNSNGSTTSSIDEIATNQFFSNPNYIMPPQVKSSAIRNILTKFSNTRYNNIENDVNNTAINRYNTLVQLLPTTHFDNSSSTYDYLRNLTAELRDVKVKVKVGVKDL